MRAEADMMEETWTQLMLGTSARHPVGLGQTSTQIRDVIFDVECLRGSDAPPCPASGDPLHAATSGGLDAAIGGLHHAALLLVSSPPDDLALGMDLPWFRAVWEVRALSGRVYAHMHFCDRSCIFLLLVPLVTTGTSPGLT